MHYYSSQRWPSVELWHHVDVCNWPCLTSNRTDDILSFRHSCDIGYPTEIYYDLNFTERPISQLCDGFGISYILSIWLCTAHGSITFVPRAKSQNHATTKMEGIGTRNFGIFEDAFQQMSHGMRTLHHGFWIYNRSSNMSRIGLISWITRMKYLVHQRYLTSHHEHRKVSNITRTKSQNLNDSRLVLQLSMSNLLKPGVKSRMKM